MAFSRILGFAATALISAAFLSHVVADERAVEGSARMLRLTLKEGSFCSGRLVPSEEPGTVGWQIPGFDSPLRFDLDAVRTITALGERDEDPGRSAQYGIELADGSIVYGEILSMDQQAMQVDSPLLGRVALRRAACKRIKNATFMGTLTFGGPLDPQQWISRSRAEDWAFAAGALVATRQGAVAVGKVDLPPRAQIDFVLSWKGVPNFVFSFGTSANNIVSSAGQVPAAARLEVWDKQLALVRELGNQADLKLLSDLTVGTSRVELTMFLDQQRGVAEVCDAYGRLLGSVQVPPERSRVRGDVHLVNNGPGLTLERFEVREWDGYTPAATEDLRTIVLDDGRTMTGQVVGLDESTRQWIVRGDDIQQTQRIDFDAIRTAPLDHPDDSTDYSKIDPTAVEVVLADRSRVIGRWLPATDGKLRLQLPLLADPAQTVRFAPEEVQGLIGHDRRYQSQLAMRKNGTLKVANWQLHGFLDDDSPPDSITALHWRPHASHNSAQILPELAGAIIYRKPLPAVQIERAESQRGRVELPSRIRVRLEPQSSSQQAGTASGAAGSSVTNQELREMVFRSGDSIDGKVEKIDQRGVYFRSPQTNTTFAPHEQVQRVELTPGMVSQQKDKQKVQRLRTIPRMDRNDPPTHLLISTAGDYLRCRLLSYEDQQLAVEVRGETHQVPADRVATIIWLHDRDWQAREESIEQTSGQVSGDTAPVAASSPFLVHAINRAGRGMTFRPARVVDGVLEGTSELLGECQIALSEVDQLLFGRRVGQRVRAFQHNPWVLSLASLPRDFVTDSKGAKRAGTGVLDRQPAPDFVAATLDDGAFRLSDHRGEIVILDFWASWCAPCTEDLPTIAEIVQAFGKEDITLALINVQESAERARTALERLGLSTPTVLDIDGRISAAYAASTIPYAVVIDRDGVVHSVASGGGELAAETVRQAIDELLRKR